MRYLIRYLIRREVAYLLIVVTGALLYANFGPHLGATAPHHRATPTPTVHAALGGVIR